MSDPIEPINPASEETIAGGENHAAAEARNFRGDLVKTFGGMKSTFVAGGVMAFVAVLVIASHFIKNDPPPPDKMRAAPQIASSQGGAPLTPAYQAHIKNDNSENAQAALQTGGSSLATPIMPAAPPAEPDTSGSTSAQAAPTVDFSDNQSDMPATNSASSANANASGQNAGFTANANSASSPPPVANNYNKDTAQAMLEAMKGLARSSLPGPNTVVADYNSTQVGAQNSQGAQGQSSGFSAGNGSASSANSNGPSGATAGAGSQQDEASKLVPAAGTILYARMIGELNSDAPGPALATIVAGPLSGARVIGEFQTERAGLVVKFSTMTVPAQDGSGTVTTPINAIAVSASDLTSGMATSINDHLLSNLGVTFVAGFVQGFGQALSQSGSTQTTTGSGLSIITNPSLTLPEKLASAGGTAAGAAGGMFQQLYGNRPTTIKLAAGTPFALVFLGTQSGVTDAQSPVQSVSQSQSSSGSSAQKLTPTLPAKSNYGTQTYESLSGN